MDWMNDRRIKQYRETGGGCSASEAVSIIGSWMGNKSLSKTEVIFIYEFMMSYEFKYKGKGAKEYREEYRRSGLYFLRRKLIFLLFDNKCAICGKRAEHLHHNSYKNFGNERIGDIIPLCESCHMSYHYAIRELRYLIDLKGAFSDR